MPMFVALSALLSHFLKITYYIQLVAKKILLFADKIPKLEGTFFRDAPF
jgi:hypothetical protein